MRSLPPLGSVSTGTLKTGDLLAAFHPLLIKWAPDFSDLILNINVWLAEVDNDDTLETDQSHTEQGVELLVEAMEALNTVSAPYCYFGALEGDGADHGWWFDRQAYDEAVNDGDIVQVIDASKLEQAYADHKSQHPDTCPDYYSVVNDHGNVTLYRPTITFEEVLGVV